MAPGCKRRRGKGREKEKEKGTCRIHACDKGKVGIRVVLGRQEKSHSPSSRNVDHIGLSSLGIHAVYLNNAHLVALEPEILAGKGAHVDDAEMVRLTWLDRDGYVLRIIHEGSIGNGFGASWVSLAHKARDEMLDLVMIPVRKGQYKLLIHLLPVGELWVVDNDWPTEAVGILSVVVRVIPVRSRLADLEHVSSAML